MTNNEKVKKSCRELSAHCHRTTKQLSFHFYSVWLFTFSDLKTIVLPSTAFGIVNGLAVSLHYGALPSASSHFPTPHQILLKTPLMISWVWLNLLPFAIENQRQPSSMKEDSINKPWRTMPSRRLSPQAAQRLMLMLYPVAVLVSLFLGNLQQCFTLILLGYWYNDLHGADASCIIRNFINACGFVCFSSGAMQVAISGGGVKGTSSKTALELFGWWYFTIASIVFTTVHSQDMSDQKGDAARNRKTVPLVIGDASARWTIAVAMALWGCITPWLWGCSMVGYMAPVVLGVIVAMRTLRVRSERGDKITFRLWNLWLVSIYLLPFIKAVETYVG